MKIYVLRPKSVSGIKEEVSLTKIERSQRWQKHSHKTQTPNTSNFTNFTSSSFVVVDIRFF